ncbi:hypothetical protein P9112_012047 [Eukaryota sp. TZLM1-RC]
MPLLSSLVSTASESPPRLLSVPFRQLLQCLSHMSTTEFSNKLSSVLPLLYPGISAFHFDRYNPSRIVSLDSSEGFLLQLPSPFSLSSPLAEIISSIQSFLSSHLAKLVADFASSCHSTFLSPTGSLSVIAELFENNFNCICVFGMWLFINESTEKYKRTTTQLTKFLTVTNAKLRNLLSSTVGSTKIKVQNSLVLINLLSQSGLNNISLQNSGESITVKFGDAVNDVKMIFSSLSKFSPLELPILLACPNFGDLCSNVSPGVVSLDFEQPIILIELLSKLFSFKFTSFIFSNRNSAQWELTMSLLSIRCEGSILHVHVDSSLLKSIDVDLFFNQLHVIDCWLGGQLNLKFPLPNTKFIDLENNVDDVYSIVFLTFESEIPSKFKLFKAICQSTIQSNDQSTTSTQLITSCMTSLGLIDNQSLSKKIDSLISDVTSTLTLCSITSTLFELHFSSCPVVSPGHVRHDSRRSSITSISLGGNDSLVTNLSVCFLAGLEMVSSDTSSLESIFSNELVVRSNQLKSQWISSKLIGFNDWFVGLGHKVVDFLNLCQDFSRILVVHCSVEVIENLIDLFSLIGKALCQSISIDDPSIKSDWHVITSPNQLPFSEVSVLICLGFDWKFPLTLNQRIMNLDIPSNSLFSDSKTIPDFLRKSVDFLIEKFKIDEEIEETITELWTIVFTFLSKYSLNCPQLIHFNSVLKSLFPVSLCQSVAYSHVLRSFLITFSVLLGSLLSDEQKLELSSLCAERFPTEVPVLTSPQSNPQSNPQSPSDDETVSHPHSLSRSSSVPKGLVNSPSKLSIVDQPAVQTGLTPNGNSDPHLSDYDYDSQYSYETVSSDTTPCESSPSLFHHALDPINGQWIPLSLVFKDDRAYVVTGEMAFALLQCHMFATSPVVCWIHSDCSGFGRLQLIKQLTNGENDGEELSYGQVTSRIISGRAHDQFDDNNDALHRNAMAIVLNQPDLQSKSSFINKMKHLLFENELNSFGVDFTEDCPFHEIVLVLNLSWYLPDHIHPLLVSLIANKPIDGLYFKIAKIYVLSDTKFLSQDSVYSVHFQRVKLPFPSLDSIVKILNHHFNSTVRSTLAPVGLGKCLAKLLVSTHSKFQEADGNFLFCNLSTAINCAKLINHLPEEVLEDPNYFMNVFDEVIEIIIGSQIRYADELISDLEADSYNCLLPLTLYSDNFESDVQMDFRFSNKFNVMDSLNQEHSNIPSPIMLQLMSKTLNLIDEHGKHVLNDFKDNISNLCTLLELNFFPIFILAPFDLNNLQLYSSLIHLSTNMVEKELVVVDDSTSLETKLESSNVFLLDQSILKEEEFLKILEKLNPTNLEDFDKKVVFLLDSMGEFTESLQSNSTLTNSGIIISWDGLLSS